VYSFLFPSHWIMFCVHDNVSVTVCNSHPHSTYQALCAQSRDETWEFWRTIFVFVDNLTAPKSLCPYVAQLDSDCCLAVGHLQDTVIVTMYSCSLLPNCKGLIRFQEFSSSFSTLVYICFYVGLILYVTGIIKFLKFYEFKYMLYLSFIIIIIMDIIISFTKN
jgi:hypothetical protein